MAARLPGLLDASLAEVDRLRPTALSATFNLIGASEANMTIPEDGPPVPIHSWVSLYTARGLAGIFRVTNAARTYKRQIQLTLLHGIDILSDSVWAAQFDFEGTREDFLLALLNQQTALVDGVKPWVLGTCADTSTIKRSINYDRLSDLLEEQVEEGGDYCFVYDQSSFPWTVSLVARPSSVSSEFRLSRNIQNATVTYNDADLCTRLYLSVNVQVEDEDTEGTVTDTVLRTYDNAAAQATWGIVVKTADIDTDDDIENESYPEADAWAAAFLARRSAPSVQIQIDGETLASLTGDTWDEVDVGRICQVALPDYGETFQERVMSVNYPDLIKKPLAVSVSLANVLPRFSENIATIRKESEETRKQVRATARSAATEKEATEWYKKVKYQGEALDGTGITTLYESGIDMDAAGGVTIYSLTEGLQALYAGITVNSSQIALKVSKGDVATQLTVECGNVHISGSPGQANLVVDGYVTAAGLTAAIAAIDNIVSDLTVNGDLMVGGAAHFDYSGAYIAENDGNEHVVASRYYVEQYAGDAVADFGTATASGGQISIPTTTMSGNAGPTINFNIADTAYYQDHVGINNTGTWVWEPEGSEYVRIITARDATTATVTLPAISLSAALGTSQSAAVSAKGPAGSSTPAQRVASDLQLYLQTDTNYAYITTNTSTPTVGQNVVARVSNSGGGTGTITEDGWAWDQTLGEYQDIVRGSSNTLSVTLPTITLTNTGFNASYKAYVNAVGPADGSGNSHSVATALEVDASGIYTAGWNAAAAAVVIPPTVSTDKSNFDITIPITGETTATYNYTVSIDSNYCYVKATASGNLKLRIPNTTAPAVLYGYTSANATGYFESEGVYVKNGSSDHFYIKSHGSGASGSGAELYMVVCMRAVNSAGTNIYYSNLDSMGTGTPMGSSSAVTIMKNQVLKGPITSAYRAGYSRGYTNGNNAVTLTDMTWNSWTTTLPTSQTIKVETQNRATKITKQLTLSLEQGAWNTSTYQKAVAMRTGSGVSIAQITVDASSLIPGNLCPMSTATMQFVGNESDTTTGRSSAPTSNPVYSGRNVSGQCWFIDNDGLWRFARTYSFTASRASCADTTYSSRNGTLAWISSGGQTTYLSANRLYMMT